MKENRYQTKSGDSGVTERRSQQRCSFQTRSSHSNLLTESGAASQDTQGPSRLWQQHKESIRRARECLFWAGMQSDIRETCLSCGICSQYHAERPKEPMLAHKITSRPWSKISVDLFALDGKQYLVMVDHYSDYFELKSLRNVAASTVIIAMKRNFARWNTRHLL